MDRVVAASTHPWAYKLHKYWARKPHNVLGQLIEELTPDEGVVVDPFCGSGVLLREASIRGRRSIGIDVNPIAVLLSSVTLEPPPPAAFQAAIGPVLDAVRSASNSLYGSTATGAEVRYVVHEILVVCDGCGTRIGSTQVRRAGRSYHCPDCDRKVRLNLRTMTGTRAVSIAYERQRDEESSLSVLAEQTSRSESTLGREQSLPNAPMIENARTLAHPGMRVSDLFTRRNWSLLGYCREMVEGIEDDRVRDAARLWLTASVAQCSRLIAHRGSLTGGGPAWTVPGFWVPPLHLETNPAAHLAARAKKFASGLQELGRRPLRGHGTVRRGDAVTGLHEVLDETGEVDLVFLDPPYGDSVPYIEFSVMWNSMLGYELDPRADMSVSDRKHSPSRWEEYSAKLKEVAAAAADAVGSRGNVLITFNNNDLRAWTALLSALHSAGLSCESVWYQIPAVVPSKAQFSPRGSYISDVYAVFRRATASTEGSIESVTMALRRCAAARDGHVPATVARRTLLIAWMEANLPADHLSHCNDLLQELFLEREAVLEWRGELPPTDVRLQHVIDDVVRRRVSPSGYPWMDFYTEVATAMVSHGIPDPWEIKEAWGDVRLSGRSCISAPSTDDQLQMFRPA